MEQEARTADGDGHEMWLISVQQCAKRKKESASTSAGSD